LYRHRDWRYTRPEATSLKVENERLLAIPIRGRARGSELGWAKLEVVASAQRMPRLRNAVLERSSKSCGLPFG
jgi:hypothetical protein